MALDTRAAFAEVLDGLESPARFAGDRRPGEYATLEERLALQRCMRALLETEVSPC